MGPPQIGGTALRAEVVPTEACNTEYQIAVGAADRSVQDDSQASGELVETGVGWSVQIQSPRLYF
jgi:hypothetical protein